MDAYVFIRGADASDIAGLRKSNDDRLRFVTALTGAYDGFVAIEANGLHDVQNAVFSSIRGAGLRDTDTSIAVRVPTAADAATASGGVPTALRRWIVQRQVEAYVRVRAERGRARDVYNAVADLDGYLGHALVAGRCDLILGFGGDDLQAVADEVLTQIHELDGVDSTVTSFAINDDGDNPL
jgi:hypothetical protein